MKNSYTLADCEVWEMPLTIQQTCLLLGYAVMVYAYTYGGLEFLYLSRENPKFFLYGVVWVLGEMLFIGTPTLLKWLRLKKNTKGVCHEKDS